MIKNNTQLRRAQVRYEQVCQTIKDLEERYAGTQLRILRSGFSEELGERKKEIEEYKQLLRLSLDEVVLGPLSKPMLLDNISELLVKLRIAAGLTQKEMANRLGWHQPNISRFESENYSGQTIAKIVEYAGSLGVWLHTVPSLTEISPEIVYRKEERSTTARADDWAAKFFGVDTSLAEDTSGSVELEAHGQDLLSEPFSIGRRQEVYVRL